MILILNAMICARRTIYLDVLGFFYLPPLPARPSLATHLKLFVNTTRYF